MAQRGLCVASRKVARSRTLPGRSAIAIAIDGLDLPVYVALDSILETVRLS